MKNLDSKRGKNPVRSSATRSWKTMLVMLACTLVFQGIQAQLPNPYVITATKDNSIYGAQRVNSTSNGKGDFLIAGMVRTPGFIRRALLYFDIPKSLIELGSAVVVDSAIMSLWTNPDDCHMHSGGKYFYAYTIPETWGEGCSDGSEHVGVGADAEAGDATWNSRYIKSKQDSAIAASNILWTSPGAVNTDRVSPVANAKTPADMTQSVNLRWKSPTLTTKVHDWIISPCINNGLIIVGPEVSPQDTLSAASFYSKDNCVDPNKSPTLIIHYHVNTRHATAAEKTVAGCCEPVAVVSKKEEEDF